MVLTKKGRDGDDAVATNAHANVAADADSKENNWNLSGRNASRRLERLEQDLIVCSWVILYCLERQAGG